jgi:hypothetical protein
MTWELLKMISMIFPLVNPSLGKSNVVFVSYMAPWVIQLIFPKVWMRNSTCGAGVDSMFSGKKRGARAAWHRCWNGRHGGYSGCDGLSSMLGKASAPSVWLGESLKRYEKMLDYMDYALLVVIELRSNGLSVLIISIPFFIVFCIVVVGRWTCFGP